jgi:hypothetical protein
VRREKRQVGIHATVATKPLSIAKNQSDVINASGHLAFVGGQLGWWSVSNTKSLESSAAELGIVVMRVCDQVQDC